MSEVVITAIGRTPIGRAAKGSLIDQRPDDLGAFVADEVLKQVPQLDRRQIDDVICGCALPGHMRAVLAAKDGIFAREIIAVPLASGITAIEDDGPRPDTTLERLAGLRAVFRKNGRVTAGNSCPLNDGAAAAVVMSRTRADELGITPIARVLSTGVTA